MVAFSNNKRYIDDTSGKKHPLQNYIYVKLYTSIAEDIWKYVRQYQKTRITLYILRLKWNMLINVMTKHALQNVKTKTN